MVYFFSQNLTISVCCIYFLKMKFLVSRASFWAFSHWPFLFAYNCLSIEYSVAWQLISVSMPSIAQSISHTDSFLTFFIESWRKCMEHLDFWHTSVSIDEVIIFSLKRCKTFGVLTFNWRLFSWKDRNKSVPCHNEFSRRCSCSTEIRWLNCYLV